MYFVKHHFAQLKRCRIINEIKCLAKHFNKLFVLNRGEI